MSPKKLLVLTGICFFCLSINAQHMWDGSYSRLGLRAGANYFNIITQDLPLTPKVSWTGGFTTRTSFRDHLQWIYGIQFYDFQNTITGQRESDNSKPFEEISLSMIGVQASFLASYKILSHYFSVEAGPVLQVNSDFEMQQNREQYYIKGYSLQAKDIQKISTFNFNLAFGISGGVEKFKFWARYQMGMNNILNGLNKENLEEIDPNASNFEGRISMVTAGVIVFL